MAFTVSDASTPADCASNMAGGDGGGTNFESVCDNVGDCRESPEFVESFDNCRRSISLADDCDVASFSFSFGDPVREIKLR